STRAMNAVGRYGMVVFGVLMACVQAYVFFGAPPDSDRAAAMTALIAYAMFAAFAGWLEKARRVIWTLFFTVEHAHLMLVIARTPAARRGDGVFNSLHFLG